MATSFDDVWVSFLTIAKMDSRDLPNEDEAIHETIQSGIRQYNLITEDTVSGDNSTEMLSRELDGNELELLAHCIRLIILENQLIYFSTMFSPFTKEVGARNLGNQMSRLQYLVEDEKSTIDSIVLKMMDEFI